MPANRRLLGLVVACLVSWVLSNSVAPGQSKKSESDGETNRESKRLQARDGVLVHVTYFSSKLGKNAPVVVLLHGKGSSSLVWLGKGGLAERLNGEGYAVVAVDLRKHGQSKGEKQDATGLKPTDYRNMLFDLEAVKQFIFAEHQGGRVGANGKQARLNMRKLAIVAPEMAAPIALNFAADDWAKRPFDDGGTPRGQDVQALVLISPDETLPGNLQKTPTLVRYLKDPTKQMAFLICCGKDSPATKRSLQIHRLLQGGSGSEKQERFYVQQYAVKLQGTDLFGKMLRVEEHILAFLGKHLKDLSGPRYEWRDRRNRVLFDD